MRKSIIYIIFSTAIAATSLAQGSSVSAADTLQVKTWLRQSRELAVKKPADALQTAQKALQLAEKSNYTKGQADSYIELGNINVQRNDYLASFEQFSKAIPQLQLLKDEYRLGQVYKQIGDVYAIRSYYREAVDSYREAVSFLRKTGQTKLMNDCFEAMGNITFDLGRFNGAVIYFKRSLNIKTALNDVAGMAGANAKLSKIYISLKNYDSAMYFTREAQRLSKNDVLALAESTIDELIILSYQGKINEAAAVKGKAEQMEAGLNNPAIKIKLLAAITNFYMAQNNKPLVEKYFDSASSMIMPGRSVEQAIYALNLLAEMSSQHEDYKTAYRLIRSAERFKDKFRTEHTERISAELKNYAEAGLKEKEIEYLNLVNKLKEEELSKEELKRMALLRENILKDSSLANQQLLMTAMETESVLRNEQLTKEKELSLSLSRENELKQKLLNDEQKNKRNLWFGMGALALLVGVIFFQYSKQRKKNQIIHKQSREMEVLNKEVHHRVKNNLQVISSMLDLQSQTLNNEKATAIIKEGIQRVQSMAFIHQNLYQGNSVNSVNMNEYIQMLSNHLFQTYNIQKDRIKLHTRIEDLNLHTDTAIPLGMILNELISNALKYAFPKHETQPGKENGDIWVTMKRNNNELLLQVKDNGVGMPPGFNLNNTSSFGYEIIKAFAQKMRARMNIDGQNGADIQLIISKFKTTDAS